MTLLGLLHRLRTLLFPKAYAREVEEEIQFHLDLEAMHRRHAGASVDDAEAAARKQFGNTTFTREEIRNMSGIEWLDRIRQDISYALRGIRRSPGFAAGVILTLALGLGVNAAMFSFLDRILFNPPTGVVAPDQVRRVYVDMILRGDSARTAIATMRYPQIREVARVDSSVALGLLTGGRDSVLVKTARGDVPARRRLANTAFFEVLGVRPILGRYFTGIEDRVERPMPVAVISHDFWTRRFGADPAVVGSTIRIRNTAITIVGVAGPGFAGIDLDRVDLWMPVNNYDTAPQPATPWYDTYKSAFQIIARFPSALDERRFLDAATPVFQSVRIARYSTDSTAVLRTGPLLSAMGPATREMEVSVAIRLGGVALIVMLIAIANVSNLQLVRAAGRAREMAVRRALGVSRGRLMEQLLTESLVLAVLSGIASLIFAIWAGAALRRLLLPRVSWSSGVIDTRMLAFAIGAALLAGIVVGLAPMLQAWKPGLADALRGGSRSSGHRGSPLRSAFVVAQAALSVVLLFGAGLFVKSLRNVQSVDIGYDVDRTMIATAVAERRIDTEVMAAMPALVSRVSAISGVEAVATASMGPMMGEGVTGISVPGLDSLPEVGGQRGASFVNVSPDYFRAAGVEVLAGRTFNEGERGVTIVSRSMAAAYWPGVSPLGKCISIGGPENGCTPVIGVVEDVHRFSVVDDDATARYYLPGKDFPALVVRADPASQEIIGRMITQEFQKLVPAAEYIRVRSLGTMLEPEFRPWRLGATLFTAFGALALLVAAFGVYSVIAYAVSQRTNEMGIRIALGAQLRDIGTLVIGDGFRTIAVGMVLGVVIAIALSRLVESLLYGVSARDPQAMIVAVAVIAAVGFAASLVPALRAARVDPVSALRAD